MTAPARRPVILFCFGYPRRLTGAQRQTSHLVSLFGAAIDARMLVFGEGDVADHLRAQGYPVTVLPWPGRLGWFGKRLLDLSLLKLAAVLLRDSPRLALAIRRVVADADLVHLVDYRAGLAVAPVARLMGRPVVGHLQGEPAVGGPLWSLYRRLPHVHVANAKAIATSLGRLPPGRITTVYSSVDDLRPAATNGTPPHTLTIGCFSSFMPFKGQHVLLDAVRLLRASAGVPPFRVWLAGSEPPEYAWYRELLDDRIREYGLDNVEMLGWRSDVRELTREIDIAVVPSMLHTSLEYRGIRHTARGNDGLPTVILEAMSLAKPVIGTGIVGIPETIVDGSTGFVVAPDDPSELADRLRRLIESAELRSRMGRAGRRRSIEAFSHEQYRDGFANVYRELLGPRFTLEPAAGGRS